MATSLVWDERISVLVGLKNVGERPPPGLRPYSPQRGERTLTFSSPSGGGGPPKGGEGVPALTSPTPVGDRWPGSGCGSAPGPRAERTSHSRGSAGRRRAGNRRR